MGQERRNKLVGPVMALRTFRTEDGQLDLDKQAFHLNWVIENGINEGNGCIMVAAGGRRSRSSSGRRLRAFGPRGR